MQSLLAGIPAGGAAAAAAVGGLVAAAALAERADQKNRLNLPPAVPGLPIIGNLHQLKEKKPHQTFARWSEEYGPIYSIRTGASSVVVVNSAEVAKEAMVAKYSSINTRKLPKALSVLTRDKKIVAMSDQGELYKMVKRYIMVSMLGAAAQKQFRDTRNTMIDNMLSTFHALVADDPKAPLNFRDVFQNELFGLSMTQALSEDVSSVYVEEFGKALSREEIYQTAVADMMMCAIEVDWRDFFPYLGWIPNRSFETRVLTTEARRTALMQALINQQKERIARGESRMSYVDFLLAENTLTDEQLLMLVWEAVIEAADTTLVTTEWAMYEIAKHPEKQEYLYQEIRKVCGNKTVTEDHLPELPYLNAVFHETLRRHSPVPLVPPRLVHESTNLAGYEVPAGTQMIINLYGCNMNKSDWDAPEEWRPERFLDGSFEVADMYKTMAFGGGRRACAGSIQAVNIACTAIARFVQEFAWTLKEGDEDKDDTIQLTTNRLYPLHVYLTPRGRK
ncbi:ent-kaurene oxidase 2 [Zea mays]|uniref:Kaurene oxidase2 n=1 Tax=Zea mays TaxID=4577 RepID=K7VA31_MAIZE|nr:ent-kaurene oxidase 2 [Zea mays]AQL04091.1 kaurene oxidase2 [Zea mays]|eukprot:XP_008659697.1 ent-kaurene oxidase 2 [Zea mays]